MSASTLPPELEVPEGSVLHQFLLMQQERISKLEDDTGRIMALLQPEQKAALALPPGVKVGKQAKFSASNSYMQRFRSHRSCFYFESVFEGPLDARAAQLAIAANLAASLHVAAAAAADVLDGDEFGVLTWRAKGDKVYGLLEVFDITTTEADVAAAVHTALRAHISPPANGQDNLEMSTNLKEVHHLEAFDLFAASTEGAICMSLLVEPPHCTAACPITKWKPLGEFFWDPQQQFMFDVQHAINGIPAPFGVGT